MKKDKLILKTLVITHFKGIRQFVLDAVTNTYVYGKNGTGKTTLVDAYRWLLTGKNSDDKDVFEIKPIDKEGNRAQKTENEVYGVFDYNGREVTLKRVHREKWTKKKGAEIPVFIGNETAYFWNDVPLKEGEYKAKVSEMIPEERLKLLTDTVYFNALKWQDRRQILSDLVGETSDEFIIEQIASLYNKEEIAMLTSIINSPLSFEERKKEIGSKKKIAKDELKLIPSRIDEVKRGLPEVADIEEVKGLISSVKERILSLDGQISNSNKAYEAKQSEINTKRKEIFRLNQTISVIENEIRTELAKGSNINDSKIKDLKGQVQNLKTKQQEIENSITSRQTLKTNSLKRIGEIENIIASRNEKLSSLKDEWIAENSKNLTFKENEFDCPCCSRPLDPEDIDSKKIEMTETFAKNKRNQLDIITKNATAEKNQLDRDVKEIESLKGVVRDKNTEIASLNEDLSVTLDNLVVVEDKLTEVLESDNNSLKVDIESEVANAVSFNKDAIAANKKIEELENEISEFKPVDHSEIIAKKDVLLDELNKHNAVMNNHKQVEIGQNRITELQNQETSLSQTIAAYEHEEFVIQQFLSKKISITESKVNGLFSFVQFRMFDKTIDGNIFDVCDTLINGVPYKDANTASKINAGLDIINVISGFYSFEAPIWIDNRESVTDILPTDTQVISLVVSPTHSELSIK